MGNLRKYAVLVGALFSIVTFASFYIGVAVILGNDVLLENIIAFIVFSLLVGLIAIGFIFLKRKIGFVIFSVFYVFSFAFMLYTFATDMTGWEGLIGLIQMMMILGAGIVIALVAELVVYLINRKKEKNITYDK